jgi:hypothetical protein
MKTKPNIKHVPKVILVDHGTAYQSKALIDALKKVSAA